MNSFQLFTLEELRELIREVVKEEITSMSEKTFMSIEEASRYLGLSKKTLYNYNNQFKITYYKNGKKLYYKKEDLDNFILNNKNRIKSEEELETEVATYMVCNRLKKM